MKHLIRLIAATCLTVSAYAQPVKSVLATNLTVPGATSGEITSVGAAKSGHFVVGGVMRFGTTESAKRGYVAKIGADGTKLWEKLIVGDAAGTGVQVDRIKVLGDDSVVVVCIGQSVTGVRFNGSNGNVIRSIRKPFRCAAAAIGDDGSMYFEKNQIENVSFTDTISPLGDITFGTTATRSQGILRVQLSGVETSSFHSSSETDLTIIDGETGAAERLFTRGFGHASKFLFDGDKVTLASSSIFESEFFTNPRDQFRRARFFMITNPSTELLTRTDDVKIGSNVITPILLGLDKFGRFAHRYIQNGKTDFPIQRACDQDTTTFIDDVTLPPITEKSVRSGGFFLRTCDNRFQPGNELGRQSEAKVSLVGTQLFEVIAGTIAKDPHIYATGQLGDIDGSTAMFLQKRSLFDGSLINVFGALTTMFRVNGGALDKVNRGQFAIGGVAKNGANTFARLEIHEFQPVLKSDSFTVTRNASTNVGVVSNNVLSNDAHVNGGVVTVHSPPATGTLVGPDANGNFVYTSTVGFSGTVSFSYKVTKPGLSPVVATVSLNILNP